MAAGLGFKDFVTGEVLTAADVDGYLMQGVWVFASAAARDSAVTSPQEGNFAYLKDTNVTTYYTGSAWANLDTTGMTNPMTTTGDTIYSSSGSTPARLGIGSTGQVLTVAGGVPSWATPAGGSTFVGANVKSTTDQSISNTTFTIVNFGGENFDTNTFHDNTTNNSRLTIPSGKDGYYLITSVIQFGSNDTGFRAVVLKKNGSDYQNMSWVDADSGNNIWTSASATISCVATDYLQIEVYQNSGGALDLKAGSNFTISYLGA
jgi:hypothetical protein